MNDSINILYLEDDKLDVELVQSLFFEGNLKTNLIHIDNEKDYIESLNEKNFDLILSDYSLPSFDGITALEIAKKTCPDIPFIIISGVLGEEVAIETLKNGATDYVLKQRLSRLVPSINRALLEAQEHRERKQAQEQLKKSLEEKKILLQEIHHRVKNNLQIICSLLDLQSKHVINDIDREMFKDSQNRIRSMAIVHEKLYQSENLSVINFNEYISDLVKNLCASYPQTSSKIKISANIEDIYIGIDNAIPCALIINELVSNSLKHAFPHEKKGEINIVFNKNKKTYHLSVSDNGIGLTGEIDFNNLNTLGLQLIYSLTKQLNGTIKLNKNQGTKFKIDFGKE